MIEVEVRVTTQGAERPGQHDAILYVEWHGRNMILYTRTAGRSRCSWTFGRHHQSYHSFGRYVGVSPVYHNGVSVQQTTVHASRGVMQFLSLYTRSSPTTKSSDPYPNLLVTARAVYCGRCFCCSLSLPFLSSLFPFEVPKGTMFDDRTTSSPKW